MYEERAMVERDDSHLGGRSNASTSLGSAPPGVGFVECRALRLPGAPEPTLGTLLCRHGGALRLVVIAKVALDMKSSPMAPVAPPPIHTADVHRGADVVVGSDLVPGRTRVDVTVDGHVRAPEGEPAKELRARLAIVQNGATVIDKTLHVLDEAGSGVVSMSYARTTPGAGPVSTPIEVDGSGAGFGPCGADRPARQSHLTQTQRALLEGPVMTLADDFDWRFFQTAPPDQQVDQLAPDATVVLEGMSAERPRLEAQLPSLRPRGGIVGLDSDAPGRGHDLTFRADSLHIHADQRVCVVTWRAVVEVASEAMVPSLTVTVGIESLRSESHRRPSGTRMATSSARTDGKALPFRPSAGPRLPPAAKPSPDERTRARHGGTLGVDEPSASGKDALPFWNRVLPRPAKSKAPRSTQTGTLDPSSRPAPPSDPLPFNPDAKPSAASPLSPAEVAPVLRGETVDIEQLKAMGMDTLPFGQPPLPDAAPPPLPRAKAALSPSNAPAPGQGATPPATPPAGTDVASPTGEDEPAEAKPKRPPERVFKVRSHDDRATRQPSPKKAPPRRTKPVQRARKRTDVNALLYQKKS